MKFSTLISLISWVSLDINNSPKRSRYLRLSLVFIGLVSFSLAGYSQCMPGALDSDSDGICDLEDKDDDNDGILDENETFCGTISLTDLTMNGNAYDQIHPNKIELASVGGWNSSYSAETFSLPIHLEFSSEALQHKMIGFLPISEPETPNTYNDNGYKLYLYLNGYIYGKVPDVWTFSSRFAHNKLVEMDIDVNGNLEVTIDGISVYTGTAPVSDYKFTFTSLNGGTYENVVIRHGNQPCQIREIDSDGDNIPNRLDLDSDGDLCVDAFEGDSGFGLNDMDANGRLTGAIDTDPMSLSYGVPISAGPKGQNRGVSALAHTPLIDFRECLCIASNNPVDSDNDGICDAIDICDSLDENLIGTACNDGDNTTVNDVWTSACDCVGSVPCVAGDLDTDNDSICDLNDKDDDNDGILDEDEGVCSLTLSDFTFDGTAILNVNADSIELNNIAAWRTSYSLEELSLPIHLEYRSEVDGLAKMIGFLPKGGIVNPNSWVDGAFKLYMHANGLIYGKFPGTWNFFASPVDQLVEFDIDIYGTATVSIEGTVVHTASLPVTDYRIAVSSLDGGAFNEVAIRYANLPCTLLDVDTDEDSIVDRIDLDSDNDLCVDAFEGDANFGLSDMDALGHLLGSVNMNGLSSSYGSPTIAGAGQGRGESATPYSIVPDIRECMCIASNNPVDSDGDGVCDSADLCSTISDALIGTSCNDNDPCTSNDTWRADCECRGELLDSDGDGICDADDSCVNFDNDIDVDDDNIPDCLDACIDVDENGVCDNQQGNIAISDLQVYTTHRRGFYDNAFNQHIFSNDPNATIYYTTDGSLPSTSSTVYNGNPLNISTSTIVRTIAVSGPISSRIETHSFIFTDDVISDPGLNHYITAHPIWGAKLKEALLSIPSISLTTDSVLNTDTTVAGSMEMLYVDKKDNFQANCGIGEYGNASVNLPKRNMRLYFDEVYGPKNLKEPVFEGFENGIEASEKHDKLDLRSSHESWLWNSGNKWHEGETYITTKIMDDIMLRGGSPNPHNRFVHVYLDGEYWGQYDLREKFDDNMMQEYLGGDNSDYNFISGSKVTVSAFYPIFGVMKDSINTDWQTVIASSNNYMTWKTMVDENSFFDLMLQFMYGFAEAEWNAVGAPSNGKEFLFQNNDADLFFSRGIPEYTNRTYPYHNANGPANMFLNLYNEAHPDFIQDFADRAAYLLEYNGSLTPTTMSNHMDELAEMIECSIIGEAAKWSEESAENPDQWRQKIDSFKINMVDIRTDIVIDQLQETGIYPILDPVQFSVPEGLVAANTPLNLINPNTSGNIYYTIDGTDPRVSGGAISSTALSYSSPINIPVGVTQVNARIKGQETRYPETNLAVNKPITASVIHATRIPEMANNDTIWGTIAENTVAYVAGTGGGDPWIEIDLQSIEDIDRIRFWDRSEASISRDAINPHIFISDVPFTSTDASVLSIDPAVQTYIYPGIMADLFEMDVNTQGRYVRILYPQLTAFYCSEIEIIQVDTANPIITDIWSAMVPQFYYTAQNYSDLIINEIHYNPKDSIYFNPAINAMDTLSGRNFEFVELKNIGTTPIHLYGTQFIKGIKFQASSLSVIQPGGFIVLAEDEYWFQQKYGFAPDGEYIGKLDNGGENIILTDPFENLIDSVHYDDDLPWDTIPDIGLYSLALMLGLSSNDLASDWGAQLVHTTPRAENIFCSPSIVSQNITNPLCPGISDGQASISATSPFGGPYTYTWSHGPVGPSINNLAPGMYVCTITDFYNCITADTILISPPAQVLLASSIDTDPSLWGAGDGSINLSTSGVNASSYSWSNGATTQDISGLSAGTYTVDITDINGCVTTYSASINPGPQLPSASATFTPNNGVAPSVVSFNASTSSDPDGTIVSYAWDYGDGNTGSGLTASHTYNSPGTYTVTLVITDSQGLTDTITMSVNVIDTCSPPTNITLISPSPNSLIVSWQGDPDAISYNLRYRDASIGGAWSNYSTSGTTAILTGLNDCTDYEVKVSNQCTFNLQSGYSATQIFSTTNCFVCTAPIGLYQFNIQSFSTIITWDVLVGVSNYTYKFRKVGDTSWNSVTTPFPIAVLFSISACTDYEWTMETTCYDGSTAQSNTINYFTTACKDEDSDMISLELATDIVVYPNPANTYINVSLPKLNKTETVLRILNMNGQTVLSKTIDPDRKNLMLDINELANGSYLISIGSQIAKFVKE